MKYFLAALALALSALAQAQPVVVPIGSLNNAGPLSGPEQFPCEQNGPPTKKCTALQINQYVQSTLAPSALIDTTNAGNILKGTLPCAQVPEITGSVDISGCVAAFAPIANLSLLGNPLNAL